MNGIAFTAVSCCTCCGKLCVVDQERFEQVVGLVQTMARELFTRTRAAIDHKVPAHWTIFLDAGELLTLAAYDVCSRTTATVVTGADLAAQAWTSITRAALTTRCRVCRAHVVARLRAIFSDARTSYIDADTPARYVWLFPPPT